MTIRMFCDRCGEEIDTGVNGGSRVRTANRELSFHLCAAHQAELRQYIVEFCMKNPPRDVNPTLSVK